MIKDDFIKMGTSTILGGGVGMAGAQHYTSDMARRALGLAYATDKDGQVQYCSRNKDTIKRAVIQSVSQTTYGLLRSYPRYIKYYENQARAKQIGTSNTSLSNKDGQYYKLIEEKNKVAEEKNYRDTIVGRVADDYLELKVTKSDYEKTYGAKDKSFKDAFNTSIDMSEVTFYDLHGMVNVSSKNNIVQTTVQGRDYSRKEFISSGDLELSISGKITSKYPDIYPSAEVTTFIKLMQYKGVIRCDHTILRQYNISQLIILNHSLPSPEQARNVQNYSFTCVAVEPDTPVELKLAYQEVAEDAFAVENAAAKWIKLARFGTQVLEPTVLLNLTKVWL